MHIKKIFDKSIEVAAWSPYGKIEPKTEEYLADQLIKTFPIDWITRADFLTMTVYRRRSGKILLDYVLEDKNYIFRRMGKDIAFEGYLVDDDEDI